MIKNILSLLIVIMLFSCAGEDDRYEISVEKEQQVEQPQKIDEELVLKKVLSEKMQLLIPRSFGPMQEVIKNLKYPIRNRPSEIYSNAGGTVSIAVNHTKDAISLEQLPEVLPVFLGQFSNLYPTIKWSRKELTKIKNRDFIVLEFITPSIDTEIYNLMAVTSLGGKMLLATFNCPVGVKEKWEEKANKIINSVEILN